MNGFQFTDPHTLPLHILSPAYSTPLEWCTEGGQEWGGAVSIFIKKYSIILYIGRLARDVEQIVPNIRQRAYNANASLICTYRYVLIYYCFMLVYWCILVLIKFELFSCVFNDVHTFPPHILPSTYSMSRGTMSVAMNRGAR